MVLNKCPLELVTRDVWEAIEMAELRRHGESPNGRGSLHETVVFNDACRFIWSEIESHEIRLKIGRMF